MIETPQQKLARWARRLALMALAAVLLVGGGFWWGHRTAANACAASAGKQSAKIEAREDKRDANIDAIGAATSAAVSAALANNQAQTHESTDRIRTVVVPGPCRDVDPGIVRELQAAADAANAALGVGVRPGPTGPGAGDPAPASRP